MLISLNANLPQSKRVGDHKGYRSNDGGTDSQTGIEGLKGSTPTSDRNQCESQGSQKTSDTFDQTLRKKINAESPDKKSEKHDKSGNPKKQDKENKAAASANGIVQADVVVHQNEPMKTVKKAPQSSIPVERAGDASSKPQVGQTPPSVQTKLPDDLEKRHQQIQNPEAAHRGTSIVNKETPNTLGKEFTKPNIQQQAVTPDTKKNDTIDHSVSKPTPDKTIDPAHQSQEGPITKKIVTDQVTSAASEPALPKTIDNESTSKTASGLSGVQHAQTETETRVSMENTLTEKPAIQSSVYKMNVQAGHVKKIPAAESQEPVIDKNGLQKTGPDLTPSSGDELTSNMTEMTETRATPPEIEVKGNPGVGLGRQVEESISSFYRPGAKQMVVRLDPPELGRLTIKFIEHRDGDITAILHADKSQTKDQIQHALPVVLQNLQDSGVQIKRFDVQLSNQQSDPSGHHPNGHNSSSEHSAPETAIAGDKSRYEHLSEPSETPATISDTGIQTTSDSINILI